MFSSQKTGKIVLNIISVSSKKVKAAIELKKKSTDQLHQSLMESPDLARFLQENEDNFRTYSVSEQINALLTEKNISKADLARNSGMSEVYLYQLLTGRRVPSRSRMLCLCIGSTSTLEETQTLLRQCGYAVLYPANRRDAIIIYGLLHNQDLFTINDALYAENEETLY